MSNNNMFDHPERMLSWLSQAEGEMFISFISECLRLDRLAMERAEEPFNLYRLQGCVKIWKIVLGYQEDFRKLIEDKKSGKRT